MSCRIDDAIDIVEVFRLMNVYRSTSMLPATILTMCHYTVFGNSATRQLGICNKLYSDVTTPLHTPSPPLPKYSKYVSRGSVIGKVTRCSARTTGTRMINAIAGRIRSIPTPTFHFEYSHTSCIYSCISMVLQQPVKLKWLILRI